jgi:voltage-gated potassium channel Kch
LIISLADQAKVAQLISAVKEHYPRVRILARAHDYDQRYELMNLGVPAEDTVHEQTGSALDLAVRALVALGKPAEDMERAVKEWRRYDEETFHLLVPAWDDFDTHASIVRQRRIQLTQLFEKDRASQEGAA